MANLVNQIFNSKSSTNTTLKVTQFSAVPRSNVVGYTVTLKFEIQMGANSSLDSSPYATDQSLGRKINLNIAGYNYSAGSSSNNSSLNRTSPTTALVSSNTTFILKRYNVTADSWDYGGLYKYTLVFNTTQIYPGTQTVTLNIVAQGSGSYTVGPGIFLNCQGVVSCPSAPVPGSPSSVHWNETSSAGIITDVASIVGNVLHWNDPPTPLTAAIANYRVREYLPNAVSNVYDYSPYTHSHTIQADIPDLANGQTAVYKVYTKNIYGIYSGSVTCTISYVSPEGMVYYKQNENSFTIGQAYVKINGIWQQATMVYSKKDSTTWEDSDV